MALPDLFSNVGPGFASYNAGFGLGQQQQGTALENLLRSTQVQRGALDNQFDEANLPTRIQQSAANLQSTLGQNTARQQGIDLTGATQPGLIEATNAKNAAAPTSYMAGEQEDRQKLFTGLAAKFSTMGDVELMANIKGMIDKYPKLANDPDFMNVIANPERALAGYQKMAQNDPKVIRDDAKQETQQQREIAKIEASGRIQKEIHQLDADNGKYLKASRAVSDVNGAWMKILSSPSYEKLDSFATAIETMDDLPEETKQKYLKLAATMQSKLGKKQSAGKVPTVGLSADGKSLEQQIPFGQRDGGAANTGKTSTGNGYTIEEN